MTFPALSVVIPAAGASLRLGQPKQLVSYRGKALILRAVETSRALCPSEIIVVTGYYEEPVKEALQNSGVTLVSNPHSASGIGGSIAKGARATSRTSTGLMVLLCDQWRVQADDLRRLAEKWQSDTQRIVAARVLDRDGPPVIFPSSCFAALNDLKGDRGAHSILAANPQLLTSVAMNNARYDLDTPDQLAELEKS